MCSFWEGFSSFEKWYVPDKHVVVRAHHLHGMVCLSSMYNNFVTHNILDWNFLKDLSGISYKRILLRSSFWRKGMSLFRYFSSQIYECHFSWQDTMDWVVVVHFHLLSEGKRFQGLRWYVAFSWGGFWMTMVGDKWVVLLDLMDQLGLH